MHIYLPNERSVSSASLVSTRCTEVPVAHSGGDQIDGALVCILPCAGMLSPVFCSPCPAYSFTGADNLCCPLLLK